MRLQRESDGKIITLNPASPLGRGGEALVYAVPGESGLVAKVYHQPTIEYARKLAAMLANPPAQDGLTRIAWPVDLLRAMDNQRQVVGFLMPRVTETRIVADFYNPGIRRRQCPLFSYLYLHRTARNLAAAVRAVHERGYVIGDVNESNILVTETALVTLVDTDSFQVRDPANGHVFRCPVGKPEFTPRELQGKPFAQIDRTPEHDLFGLAVLMFQLLMEGTHPFAGVFQGQGDPPSLDERILSGHFPYSTGQRMPYRPARLAPPFELLHPTLRQLFVRCFEDGHHNPQARPNAQTWQRTLNEAEKALVICPANAQHRYGNHLQTCPWCERAKQLRGRDPFPSQQAVARGEHLRVAPAHKPSPTLTPPAPPPPPRITPPAPPAPVVRPPGKGWAVAARICAVLGVCMPWLGLVTIVCGVLAWRRAKVLAGRESWPAFSTAIGVLQVIMLVAYLVSEIGIPLSLLSSKDSDIRSENNFVHIPAGEFMMGAEYGAPPEYQVPAGKFMMGSKHQVKISRDFELGKYEVTQAQWEAVMRSRPSHFEGADQPVEKVSWDDAQEFIKKLNQNDGKHQYRLPTETEWEYACRAGSTGDYAENLDAMAWYINNANNQTHPVGQKQANQWGLYDMRGNVREWCQDWYDSSYYGKSPAADPQGPSSGYFRVIRGGSCYGHAEDCGSADRGYDSPGNRGDDLGFRLLRTAR